MVRAQCVAVFCSVLQSNAVCPQRRAPWYEHSVFLCIAVCLQRRPSRQHHAYRVGREVADENGQMRNGR